ncbi:MAG: 23S rRNA (guanosine(2251)-2'-O)-methyltransferase RlmB [Chloroflexota bacterium]
MPEFVYGNWAIVETMRAGRRSVEQLILADGVEEKGTTAEIVGMANELNVPIKRMPRRILDDVASGGNHQGAALRVSPYPYAELEDVLQTAADREEKPFILLLDLLKDPQNVGALLRTAETVGVHGVVMQDRRNVDITSAVVNASSGAVEHLNVVQVTNLVNAMKELKENNVWMVGLDAGPNVPPIGKTDLNMPIGLVMGSEGEGMRRLVKDTCDFVLSIPMRGKVASLNVSAAGAIALYSAWQAREWEGWAHA